MNRDAGLLGMTRRRDSGAGGSAPFVLDMKKEDAETFAPYLHDGVGRPGTPRLQVIFITEIRSKKVSN